MSELSPAAKAVLDAAKDVYGINYSEFYCCADRAPQLPADGEVAELVAVLRADADCITAEQPDLMQVSDQELRRAADLLERLGPPQPVPVSERLPGPGDCDAEGLCWVWNTTAYTWGLFRLDLTVHSHWLPAHALPQPS